MKKIMSLLLGLSVFLFFVSCEAKDDAADGGATVETVKFGTVFPMTGANADQGVFNVDGAEFIVDYINDNGGIAALGGAPVELVIYDNMSDAEQSRIVAERLIEENPGIAAVTGAASSTYVLPMLSVFERAEVPFYTAQVSESITSQGYNYAFRVGSTGGSFAEYQIKFVQWLNEKYGLGITKIGVVYEDTEWGLSNTNGTKAAIENAGGFEIVYLQSFTANSSDLSNVVTGLKNSGAEVVFPTCYTQDAKLLFNTMKTMAYSPLIIGGGGGFLYPSFAEELGESVDGVVSVTGHNYDLRSFQDSDLELFKNFGPLFEAEYGYFPPEQAVATASALYTAWQAIEHAGSAEGAAMADASRELRINTLTPGSVPATIDETGANTAAHAVIIQWQLEDDGVYRTRTIFPEQTATADLELTEGLQAMMP